VKQEFTDVFCRSVGLHIVLTVVPFSAITRGYTDIVHNNIQDLELAYGNQE
jgi:hypothetical protein